MDTGEAARHRAKQFHQYGSKTHKSAMRTSDSRNQVGLELVQVDVQRSIESQRSGDGRDDLGDQPVEVGVSGRLDSEVLSANVVDAVKPSTDRTLSPDVRL